MQTNKQEWVDLIEQKLKDGKSYSDLIHEGHGIVREPIHMSREGILDIPSAPILPKSITCIDTCTNADIRTLLNMGVQALYTTGPVDIEPLLHEVHRAYIDIYHRASGTDIMGVDAVLDIGGSMPSFVTSSQELQSYTGKSLLIRYQPTSDFNLSIAQVRVLKLLLSEHDIQGKIIAVLDPKEASTIGDYNLIEITYKTLSSLLGGADYVQYDPSDSEAFRLHQNLLWMLIHEARIDHVVDPTKGSYLIENITTQLYRQIER